MSDKHPLDFPPRAVCHLYGDQLYVGTCPMVEDGSRLAFPLETVPVASGGRQLGPAIRRALGKSLQIVCHPRPKLGLLLTKTRDGRSPMGNLAATERPAAMVPAEGGMLSSAPRAEGGPPEARPRIGARGDPSASDRDVVEPLSVGRREATARKSAAKSTKSALAGHSDLAGRRYDLERSMEAWLLSKMLEEGHRNGFLFGAVGVVVEVSDGAPTLMPIARRSKLVDGRMWYGGRAPLRTPGISRNRIVEFRLEAGASDEEFGCAVPANLLSRRAAQPRPTAPRAGAKE